MLEKLTNVITNRILSSIVNKVTGAIQGDRWKELFIDSGEFLGGNNESKGEFQRDLQTIFSKENMEAIAKDLKGKSGLKLKELLHLKLYNLMIGYDIDKDLAESYIHHFMQIIFTYIENNEQDKDTQNFMVEWREEENKDFNRIQQQLTKIVSILQQLEEQDRSFVLTINEVNQKLREEINLPNIDLSFFEIDDEEFLNQFHKSINQECIYVAGRCREETTYCILNEIRKMNLDKATLVVTNEEEWGKLTNERLNNTVLIPFFYAGSIRAISGNVNIFIFGEEESCYGKEYLTLRKRTRNKISECLKNAGIEYEEADILIRDTHGLYVPMKKKLYKGAMYQTLAWEKANRKVIVTALLCQKWTECVGDKLVLEELSGMKYDEFLAELMPYMKGENPFVIEVNGRAGKSIQLASIEQAWEELDSNILEQTWCQFIELVYEVLIESEPIFEYPFEKHFEASVYADPPEWSSVLKHGMLHSLIMRAYYRKHQEKQYQVNKVVKRILDTISTKQRWGYIAEYFTDLCEATPDIIITRLEEELTTSTGMIDMFSVQQGDYLTARNYYTHILWAVEQLIMQKQYVIRAIRWLWEVDALNIKYSITNSPKSILEVIFCAWINESVLSVQEKIENAKWAIGRFENAWDIIYSELPTQRQSICSTLSKPHYRDADEASELTYGDINTTYLEYIHACIDNINKSVEKWIKIISNMSNYYDELIDEIFIKLDRDIQLMDDKERILIKEQLRDEVYKHRYFVDAEWTMPEERVCKFEVMLNKIKTENPIYEYMYLFGKKWNFPLLHPIPYKEKSSNSEEDQNKYLAEHEIEASFKKFEKEHLSLKELLKLTCEKEDSTIGFYIAKYYGSSSFSIDILKTIIEIDLKGNVIYDYISFFGREDKKVLKEAIKLLREEGSNCHLIASLITLETISNSNKETCLILSETEEIKEYYWSREYIFNISNEREICLWAISECKKYGNINSYLSLLFDKKEILEPRDLYNVLIQLPDFANQGVIFNSLFYLQEVLKIVQKYYIANDEKCESIASIEWLFRNILPWEDMCCVQKLMKKSPQLYAMLVEIIYLKEGSKKEDTNITEEERNISKAAFDVFYKAHFCPAEQDGEVKYEELKKWLNDFRQLLISQKQERLFSHLVGKLLAYSPIGKDNYMPCEAVRSVIENIEDFEDFKNSYCVEEENKRGVHTIDDGKSTRELSRNYQENADAIRSKYPKTAIIYDLLSSNYKSEANYERRRAEDEW